MNKSLKVLYPVDAVHAMATPVFDVVIVGGSLTGLLAAREIAKAGKSIAILEEHFDIGLPEKCDGLVTKRALAELGIIPSASSLQAYIKKATFKSPSGFELEIDAGHQGVVVLDRSILDKQLGLEAAKLGAEIRVGERVLGMRRKNGFFAVSSQKQTYRCEIAIDCRGSSSYLRQRAKGILPAGKYEVRGDWIDAERVEVHFNNQVTPGFFTWVIPTGNKTAKVGAAGNGISPFSVLDSFLNKRRSAIMRKITAPILVGGPLQNFSLNGIIMAGEAAGQSKPTTAGGIYSAGMGGLLAGQAIVSHLNRTEPRALLAYQKRWQRIFGGEFRRMAKLRRIFEQLTNDEIDRLLHIIAESSVLKKISLDTDFDFHTLNLARNLGSRGLIGIAALVARSGLRDFFPRTGRSDPLNSTNNRKWQ